MRWWLMRGLGGKSGLLCLVINKRSMLHAVSLLSSNISFVYAKIDSRLPNMETTILCHSNRYRERKKSVPLIDKDGSDEC